MNRKLVLGTRGSELAQTQARMVVDALREKWSQLSIEIRIIKTMGDERADAASLDSRAGRKGLFTSEIERALLAKDVDLAVHSAKDLPSELSAGTELAAVLPRGHIDDVLIGRTRHDVNTLPPNAVVATGSVRRKYQLHWKRSDLEVVDLRGNIPTRLRKFVTSQWDAIVLARAGLERLGLNITSESFHFDGSVFFSSILAKEVFVPAGGQGIVAIQIREGDDDVRMLLEAINNLDTRLCLRAEREFLRLLKADCNQPVGVLADVRERTIQIRAQLFVPGTAEPRAESVTGRLEDTEELAARLFAQMSRS